MCPIFFGRKDEKKLRIVELLKNSQKLAIATIPLDKTGGTRYNLENISYVLLFDSYSICEFRRRL
jgi:hypothetical protein